MIFLLEKKIFPFSLIKYFRYLGWCWCWTWPAWLLLMLFGSFSIYTNLSRDARVYFIDYIYCIVWSRLPIDTNLFFHWATEQMNPVVAKKAMTVWQDAYPSRCSKGFLLNSDFQPISCRSKMNHFVNMRFSSDFVNLPFFTDCQHISCRPKAIHFVNMPPVIESVFRMMQVSNTWLDEGVLRIFKECWGRSRFNLKMTNDVKTQGLQKEKMRQRNHVHPKVEKKNQHKNWQKLAKHL